MVKINYNQLRRKAHKVIRDNGARFVVDGRRGYAVRNSESESWRDDSLVETTVQSFVSTIEVSVGSVIEFAKTKERMRVTDCQPEAPDGVPIVWNLTAQV